MRSKILILTLSCNLTIFAQNNSSQSYDKTNFLSSPANMYSAGFFTGTSAETGEPLYFSEGERLSAYNSFAQPVPPVLTANATDLEICTGNSTRLTASSSNKIYWYTTPPPLGSPVGTGPSYITPILTTGYYTYYAIADNDGIKSDITSMEVVMVYPNPVLNILSNVATLCASETATLTVSGTTYYEWENGPVSSKMTIRPSRTQDYKVTGINTAGCKSTTVYTQSVEVCMVDEEAEINSGQDKLLTLNNAQWAVSSSGQAFSVYPNPNNGEFSVRVNSISESTRVEVYNGQGALAYSNKVTSEITAVTLKDYSNGIYIVRIIENDKILKQEKIVKE